MKLRLEARTRARLNSMVMGMLLLCVAGLLAWLSTRYPLEADWTAAGRHTLSAASRQVLGRLDGPLDITAYAREEQDLRTAVRDFVQRYQRARPDISLRFVNPDAAPDEVRNLGISVNGELILRYQGRVEHVRNPSEEEFTNAVQRLLRSRERWLAFVEGHGERSAVGRERHDLGVWVDQLRRRGFRYQPLNLGETRAIPDNTSVLVIAGPRSRMLPGEVALITDYVDGGGNLLWLLDPGTLQGLEPLAEQLGVRLLQGTVIDVAGRLIGLDDPTITVVTARLYGDHDALDGFDQTTFYPGAGAMRHDPDRGWQVTPLLTTGDHAWLETGALEGHVEFDADSDTEGPLAIGLALERHADDAGAPQRIAVISDGDFLSNGFVNGAGNLELGTRLINWLGHEEDFIAIPVRTAGDAQLDMDSFTLGALGIFFLLLLPAGLLAAGAAIWWRRRRR